MPCQSHISTRAGTGFRGGCPASRGKEDHETLEALALHGARLYVLKIGAQLFVVQIGAVLDLHPYEQSGPGAPNLGAKQQL
jgi:hypothetical protein